MKNYKQPKTQKKSILQAVQKAVRQTQIDVKQVKEECEHKLWNFTIGTACPQCGITSKELFKANQIYKGDS